MSRATPTKEHDVQRPSTDGKRGRLENDTSVPDLCSVPNEVHAPVWMSKDTGDIVNGNVRHADPVQEQGAPHRHSIDTQRGEQPDPSTYAGTVYAAGTTVLHSQATVSSVTS